MPLGDCLLCSISIRKISYSRQTHLSICDLCAVNKMYGKLSFTGHRPQSLGGSGTVSAVGVGAFYARSKCYATLYEHVWFNV